MNSLRTSVSVLATLSLFFITPVVASDFEKVSRNIESLPKPLYQVQYTAKELHHETKIITVDGLLKKIKKTPSLNVFLSEDKFTDMPKTQIELIAGAVIQSGGRFFYKKTRGSIDSIFMCVEFKKEGAPSTQKKRN